MPLPPDALKSRYDRLSFRVTAGLKSKLAEVAGAAGVLPTEWIEIAISKAYERQQKKSKKDHERG